MSNSAFSPAVLTIPGTGTSSSGQGELNLITNPVAAVNLDGWVGAGRGTSGGPLNPTITTYFTVLNAVPGSPPYESSTSGAYDVISLPSGLQNKKLKVEFYYTSPALDTFKVSVYKGTTRVPLTTDVSGTTSLPQNTTGKFVAYFDTDSSGTWTVAITRTAGTGGTALQFTNVVVGPGIQPQGAVVGPETSYTLTVSGSASAPTLGTNTAQAVYERIGDIMHVRYSLKQTSAGTAGSGTYLFSLPSGVTVDSSRLASTYQGSTGLGALGAASLYDGTKQYTGYVAAYNSTNLFLVVGNEVTTPAAMGSTTYSLAGTNVWVSFDCRIPIAEWAGSGTVQLAQNDVEYAWNADTSTTLGDTSKFGYGPQGAQIQAISVLLNRRVRFQSPIQTGDRISIELSADKVKWTELSSGGITDGSSFTITPWQRQGPVVYGVGALNVVNSTDIDVSFGTYCQPNGVTFGANGQAWAGAPGNYYWRVRKSSAGAAVGFGIVAPGVSSGLVSASGLPGNTTGNAIASGYVGEVITKSATTSTLSAGTAATTVYSTTVSAGVYIVIGNMNVVWSAAPGVSNYDLISIGGDVMSTGSSRLPAKPALINAYDGFPVVGTFISTGSNSFNISSTNFSSGATLYYNVALKFVRIA